MGCSITQNSMAHQWRKPFCSTIEKRLRQLLMAQRRALAPFAMAHAWRKPPAHATPALRLWLRLSRRPLTAAKPRYCPYLTPCRVNISRLRCSVNETLMGFPLALSSLLYFRPGTNPRLPRGVSRQCKLQGKCNAPQRCAQPRFKPQHRNPCGNRKSASGSAPERTA